MTFDYQNENTKNDCSWQKPTKKQDKKCLSKHSTWNIIKILVINGSQDTGEMPMNNSSNDVYDCDEHKIFSKQWWHNFKIKYRRWLTCLWGKKLLR